jgi:hypothetical protein
MLKFTLASDVVTIDPKTGDDVHHAPGDVMTEADVERMLTQCHWAEFKVSLT